MLMRISLTLCVLATFACGSDEPPEVPEPEGTTDIAPYSPCEIDEDCGDAYDCVQLLGTQVCAQTGCADEQDMCALGTTCVISAAVNPSGVCARTGDNQFCARNCGDPLECNLKRECTTSGCCNTVNPNGCPSACADMSAMNCEVSPQCPVHCCEDGCGIQGC